MIIDRDRLYDLYINKHMRMIDVAKIYGFKSYTPIKKALVRYNIPIRKRGYGFSVKPEFIPTLQQYRFFDGLMLSDGSIARRNDISGKKCGGNDFLSCAFKHKEFAQYIKDGLDLQPEVKKKIHTSDRYKSGQCVQYGILSGANIFYTKERDRWYPNGTKIIPRDFHFSPEAMNVAYLGDGFLSNNRTIYIATQSFKRQNIEDTLIRWLQDIGIRCWVTNDNQVCISSGSSEDFLKYIGSCPVECYKHKWDFNTNVKKYYQPTSKELYYMYITQGLSTTQIGNKLGISYNAVNHHLRTHNIPIRTRKESTTLYHKQKESK